MTTNGLHAISDAIKLKLLLIPKAIKQKIKLPRIMELFLFLNKSLNHFSLDDSFLSVGSVI
tara:strand:- start:347 stop:529 length:183 start_codon:yes stop_codon:yes gene_type:complete